MPAAVSLEYSFFTRHYFLIIILTGLCSCGIGTSDTDKPTPSIPSLASIRINEVDADTPGSDDAEFIELYNSATEPIDLSGTVLVFYNGNDDSVYNNIDLNGHNIGAGAYFVIGNTAADNVNLTFNDGLMQNGADAIALYHGNASDYPNDQSVNDAQTEIIDALVYGTGDSDNNTLINALTPSQTQIDEDGKDNAEAVSMQRTPNGTGAAQKTSTYQLYAPTPGAANTVLDPAPINITATKLETLPVYYFLSLLGSVETHRKRAHFSYLPNN